jgi:hypothetical protein
MPTHGLPLDLPPARPPCVSLYQPTHRHFPDRKQDPIRFRNLVGSLEASLRQRVPDDEAAALLRPLHELAADADFWNHPRDGLAVLASPDGVRIWKLQRPVAEHAVVADSFHLKPLLGILQSADRFHVLALERGRVRLFEGNRDALDEVDLSSVVRGPDEGGADAVPGEPPRVDLAVGTGGGGGGTPPSRDSQRQALDTEAEKFFRAVDRAILAHHSRPTGLPLLLAAVTEHHALFRRVSHNPMLLPEAIEVHPESLTTDALRGLAWQRIEPRWRARLDELGGDFARERGKGLGAEDVREIGPAAAAGRVRTLLVEADRAWPGRIDPDSGEVSAAPGDDPGVDDAIDDLAELVMRRDGEVVVVPRDRMPVDTGVAAVYRF